LKVAASGLYKPRDEENTARMKRILDWMRKLVQVRMELAKETKDDGDEQ